MTTRETSDWPEHVRRCRRRSELRAYSQNKINMAVWDRTMPSDIADEIANLPFSAFPNLRFITANPEKDVRRAFRRRAKEIGTPFPEALCADVIRQVNTYRKLRGLSRVLIRLEALCTPLRQTFHGDGVEARLLCTYRGIGTEWLAEGTFSRARMDCGERPDRRVPSRDIRRLANGHVAMIRGDAWPRAAGRLRGLVHRAPRIRTEEDWRWFLLVDDARFAVNDKYLRDLL